jgi:hypothetical protein
MEKPMTKKRGRFTTEENFTGLGCPKLWPLKCLGKMTIHDILQYPPFSQQIDSTTTASRLMINADERDSVPPIIRNPRHHFLSRPKWINPEHS